MGVIGIILLVAFVIICILLVCLVLLQNEEGGGLGGLFGGGSSTAFGSRSANVLTKTTYVLVTLFFVASFFLALINKSPTVRNLDNISPQTQESTEEGSEWWNQPSTEISPSDSGSTGTETGSPGDSSDNSVVVPPQTSGSEVPDEKPAEVGAFSVPEDVPGEVFPGIPVIA